MFGISLVGLFDAFAVVFLVLLPRLGVVVLVGLVCCFGLLLLQWFLVPGLLAHLIWYIPPATLLIVVLPHPSLEYLPMCFFLGYFPFPPSPFLFPFMHC